MKNLSGNKQVIIKSIFIVFLFLILSVGKSSAIELEYLWGHGYSSPRSPVAQSSAPILDLGPTKATDYLTKLLAENTEQELSTEEVLDALSELEDPASADAIIKYGLTSPESHSRKNAVIVLGLIQAEQAIPKMLKLLNDKEYFVEAVVYEALARMKAKSAVPELITHAKKAFSRIKSNSSEDEARDISTVYDTCLTLGTIGDKQAISFLREVFNYVVKQDDPPVRAEIPEYALAKIGDVEFGDTIAKLDSYEIRALSILKNPQALVRARKILNEISEVTYEDESTIFESIKTIAKNGTSADIKLLKDVLKKFSSMTLTEVVYGIDYPFGEGTYYLMPETFPIYIGWALTVLGDTTGEQILDKALKGNDALAATEASRFYVKLKRTDKYDLIAKTLRKFFGRKEYENDSSELDRGWSARTDIMNMLAEQQTPSALQLLVQTVNDDNINIVIVARRAIRTYPTSQSLPLLEKQLIAGGEWEKWQIATQMEFAGEEGLDALYKIAKGSNDTATRAVALRAVIRARMSGWKNMLCDAAKDNSQPMKELIEWMKNYFEGDDDKSILACVN